MASYIGLIHKDTTSDFGVSFPDFPGCVSAGSTLDEAQRMGQEALQLHVDGAQEDGAEMLCGISGACGQAGDRTLRPLSLISRYNSNHKHAEPSQGST